MKKVKFSTIKFNGDGISDLAGTNRSPVALHVSLGLGDGTFTPIVPYDTQPFPSAITTGDFNGDGITDLAHTSYLNDVGGGMSLLLGIGDGTFEYDANFSERSRASSIVSGDFDGDGQTDIATSSGTFNTASVFLNQRSPDFLIGDVNRDGVVDLLDAAPFVDLLVSGEFQAEADINGDGEVNLLDIPLLVDLLTGN